jgi:hypothetical protein
MKERTLTKMILLERRVLNEGETNDEETTNPFEVDEVDESDQSMDNVESRERQD